MEVRVFSFLTMLCVGLYGESMRAECAKSKVNLVFLFDGSSSMTTEDFQKNKLFIWDIVTTLRNSSIEFAAVQFSKTFRTVFTFEDYANGTAKDKLDKEVHMKELTNTHNAIQFILKNLFDNVKSGADPEATKALVIITDGAPSDIDSGVIKRCDDLDIIRFVVGVGNIDLEQLNNLASKPKHSNTFKIENYDGLNGLLKQLQIHIYGTKECAKSKVNLVFLFDGSSSMTTEDFQKNKLFIWDIVTTLRNSSIKFAAVQFSRKFRTVFTFEDYANGTAKDKLDKEVHMKELTDTHNAIQFTLDNLFDNVKSGADPEATKALVIITDGAPSDIDSGVIKRCDDLDIIRIVIGVGNIDLEQLKNIASKPKHSNTFKIENYDGLNGLLKQLQIHIYGIEEGCTNPTVTPSSLAVAWGDPVHVTCSIPNKPTGNYRLSFESPLAHRSTTTETNVTLQIDSLMKWVPDERHWCVLTVGPYQCSSSINFTFYRRPDNVTLRSVSDVWVEGDQTELLCEIINVGRGRALSVRWSRADPEQNSNFTQFNETFFTQFNEMFFPKLLGEIQTVNKAARLKVTPRREDDGAQYRCDAVLNLSQHGSRVFASQLISITVHYKPVITHQPPSEVLSVPGENLTLRCQADGNPSPVYSWTLSNGTKISNSSSINITSVHEEDQGRYTCTTSNSLGNETRIVSLTVIRKPDSVTLRSVSDVWVEGDQTELLCEIINVGRGRALSVRWSRADPEPNSNFTQFNETFFPELNNETKTVNKTVRLKVTPRREDDGAQYRCDAVLNLSQHGSQVFASEPIPITVRSN